MIRLVRDQMGMMTFQFLDADTKNPMENFYVFPDEAKFEKVKQTKDRVYLLEMKATAQRYFFWMQVSSRHLRMRSNNLIFEYVGG